VRKLVTCHDCVTTDRWQADGQLVQVHEAQVSECAETGQRTRVQRVDGRASPQPNMADICHRKDPVWHDDAIGISSDDATTSRRGVTVVAVTWPSSLGQTALKPDPVGSASSTLGMRAEGSTVFACLESV